MRAIANELDDILEQHLGALPLIGENDYLDRPGPGKWSKKEILGHLIDSAQNNIRRFVIAQYEDRPIIIYDQDKWVSIANYQGYNLPDLISFWYLINKHICHILRSLPEGAAQRESETSSVHTIEWLASDYIKHLLHHLHQILELEPVPYP